MSKLDLRVDVTDAVGTGEALEVAMTVVLPDEQPPTVAMFGFPGGGYSRTYYDLPLDGYSQAEHHARQGFAFIACDHLGVGDSSVPTTALDYQAVARANGAAAAWTMEQLRAGSLGGASPAPISAAVGMGQSYGGLVLTLGEGTTPVFDGVAILGWSAIVTLPPWSSDVDLEAILAGTAGNGLDHPMRKVFHAPDVPADIVVADMTKKPGALGSGAPWSADQLPGGPAVEDPSRNPLAPGVVSAEAAAITAPVLIAAGDIDVIPDAHAEPAAYRSSRDVTVCTFPNMGHMHNFASTRVALWDRLAAWAWMVAGSA